MLWPENIKQFQMNRLKTHIRFMLHPISRINSKWSGCLMRWNEHLSVLSMSIKLPALEIK